MNNVIWYLYIKASNIIMAPPQIPFELASLGQIYIFETANKKNCNVFFSHKTFTRNKNLSKSFRSICSIGRRAALNVYQRLANVFSRICTVFVYGLFPIIFLSEYKMHAHTHTMDQFTDHVLFLFKPAMTKTAVIDFDLIVLPHKSVFVAAT